MNTATKSTIYYGKNPGYQAGKDSRPQTPRERQKAELLAKLRAEIELLHYSRDTLKAYRHWVAKYIDYKDVRTTMIYTHVVGQGTAVVSPADALLSGR